MGITYFCPQCWSSVAADDIQCPYCGHNLSKFSELPYEDILLLALNHPVRENRRMAVYILGELGSARALPRFQEILDTEDDFYMLREILQALLKIAAPQSDEMLRAAANHRLPLVAAAARTLISDRKNSQPPDYGQETAR